MKPNQNGKNASNENWTTERRLFDLLDSEAGFSLDAAASEENHLCDRYITAEMDAFVSPWAAGGPVFLNHPYGIGKTARWMKRAREQALEHRVPVYALSPASMGSSWMHHLVVPFAAEIRVLVGRVMFGGVTCKDGSIGMVSAPFDSCVIVFPPRQLPRQAHIWTWNWRQTIRTGGPG